MLNWKITKDIIGKKEKYQGTWYCKDVHTDTEQSIVFPEAEHKYFSL